MVFADIGGALGHTRLHCDRTLDRVYCAGELDQGAITHQLDKTAPVLGDHRFEKLFPVELERGQGARFVQAHQAAIADHVGS